MDAMRWVMWTSIAAGSLALAGCGASGSAAPTPTPVAVVNAPPLAVIADGPDSGEAPLVLDFDSAGSTDPDGTIAGAAWDFGDGLWVEGATARHTFEDPGEYTVTLRVTDDQGATHTAIRAITVSRAPVALPVRVLSAGEATTRRVSFDIADASAVDTLYVQCHRCTYRDVSTNPDGGAKASLRLNGGTWLDISNDTVEPFALEKSFGGLNYGFHTVRFTVPVQARDGLNTLDFRFNGTDGVTTGFRVLDFNLRAAGRDVLDADAFSHDDPADWRPPLDDPDSLAAGEALWRGAVPLVESPLDATQLRASCADCHAQDGRDLKYFAFSNESIRARSAFHGLSDGQAEQIASYIRSLDVDVPETAAPWNPPYQPGPGLDARPADEWSAGAGLDAVLERDADMLDYLLPQGTGAQAAAAVFDVDGTLNMRELPVAIQFPDWNAWLPQIHPLDNWGDDFQTRIVQSGASLQQHYDDLRAVVDDNDVEDIIADGRLKTALNRFASATSHLGSHQGDALRDSGREPRQEDGKGVTRSLVHWSAVKQWEVQQEFALDGRARDAGLYGPDFGEARSWVSLRRNVFDMAPHRLAPNLRHFDFQSELLGKTRSTQWYHLQLIINSGAREGYNLGPVDWNYQPAHINDLIRFGGPAQPVRYAASHAKMLQYMTDGKQAGERGGTFAMRQLMPSRHMPDTDLWLEQDLAPAARRALLTGIAAMRMDTIERRDLDIWPREEGRADVVLGPIDAEATPIPRNDVSRVCHGGNYDRCFYTAIPILRDAGVEDDVVARMIDWGERAWPAGDWDTLR